MELKDKLDPPSEDICVLTQDTESKDNLSACGDDHWKDPAV